LEAKRLATGFLSSLIRPLWPELLAAALVLLPFDIAVRRLVIERRDLLRAWNRLAARFSLRPAAQAAGSERTPRVATLLKAKERAEERRLETPQVVERPAVNKPDPGQVKEARRAQDKPAPVKPVKEKPIEEPSKTGEEEDVRPSTTAALLARKRSRDRGKDS
jgi:hypothetical protein